MRNRYGLPRTIPSDMKRIVRARCGFGCVICGSGIIQYEHVDPLFADAKEHDPSSITLLCPACHDKVTRRFLSKDSVTAAMAKPACRQRGFAKDWVDIGRNKHPYVHFAGVRLENCIVPIEVDGYPVLQVKAGDEEGAPFRISGIFCNSAGRLSLEIRDNEWLAFESNWDVEATGGAIIVRDAPGHVSLRLELDPPHGLAVAALDMRLYGWTLQGDRKTLRVRDRNSNEVDLTNCVFSNCRVGVSLGNRFHAASNDHEW